MKPTKTHEALGQIIRDHRIKKKLTQAELAKKLNYDSVQFVSLFERGISKVPFHVLGRLVVILGIPEKKVIDMLVQDYEVQLKEHIRQGKKK